MTRLFVAVSIPPEVRAEIEAAVERLPAELRGDGMRWVRPQAWHLTLSFLGAVGAQQVDDVTVRLGRAAARAEPFTIAVSGAGRFGQQVLWAGITGDRKALGRLAESTGAAARRAGIAVDTRPYRPHLTLARGNGASDLRPVAEALAALDTARWTVDELMLIESLGAGPGRTARHNVASRWTLGRQPTARPLGGLPNEAGRSVRGEHGSGGRGVGVDAGGVPPTRTAGSLRGWTRGPDG